MTCFKLTMQTTTLEAHHRTLEFLQATQCICKGGQALCLVCIVRLLIEGHQHAGLRGHHAQ